MAIRNWLRRGRQDPGPEPEPFVLDPVPPIPDPSADPAPAASDGPKVQLFQSATAWEWGRVSGDGALVIEGQDLGPDLPGGVTEYEYAITVPPEGVDVIRRELGAGTDEQLLAELVARYEQISRTGVLAWLEGLGITPAFWGRHGFD